MALFNYNTTRIITNDSICYSTSELRITTSSISFNLTAAAELGYPETVAILADDRHNGQICLGIVPWRPEYGENTAIPFYNKSEKYTSSKRIIIKNRDFAASLRAELNIADTKGRKVYGVLYRDDNILFFDLSKSVPVTSKTPRKRPVTLSNYPPVSDIMKSARPVPLALPAAV